MITKPDPGPRLGAGKEAEVFAWGPLVLKLYRRPEAKPSAFREAAILALVGSLGLPAPSVEGVERVNERWGVVMTRAEGPSFAEEMIRQPERLSTFLAAMVRLQAHVHRHSGTRLAGMKQRLEANIREATALGPVRQRRLLDGLEELPEENRLCHGDFHPWNIIGAIGREVIVDWLDGCAGDPAADVARSYVLMKPSVPDLARDYVETYAKLIGMSRDDISRWLPYVAAARIAEGVPDEIDGLMEMADSA